MKRLVVPIVFLALCVVSASCSDEKVKASGTPAAAAASTTTTAPGPIPSAGCSAAPSSAIDGDKVTMDVGGEERWYLITAPASVPGKPAPLVLDMHGLAEGAQIHAKMSNSPVLAKTAGFIDVLPNGTGDPLRWNADPTVTPNHDLEFFGKMLDDIEAQRCVDTSRVYAMGLSYGAIMSSFLACTWSDRIAAVAPVAGVTVRTDCAPKRAVPVIGFHGTADPILFFNGGIGDLSDVLGGAPPNPATTTTTVPTDLNGPGYPANVARWAERNGCKKTPTDTKVTADIIHRVYSCPVGADVEFYILVGGGHAWPGSEFSKAIASVVGPTNMDIDATKLAWEFLSKFRLPAKKK